MPCLCSWVRASTTKERMNRIRMPRRKSITQTECKPYKTSPAKVREFLMPNTQKPGRRKSSTNFKMSSNMKI